MIKPAAGASSSARLSTGSSSSRITSVSRVVMPTNGGLTIRPPQKMADVATLWAPLSHKERRFVAQAKNIPVQLDDSHVVLKDWLPPHELLTMQAYYYRLTASNQQVMARTLARAQLYLPDIQRILQNNGIPQALAYLPMVESAYEPEAISHAGAVGLWQLMPATATRFGLVVNANLDERLDPIKSTHAAAAYLRWLYEYFGDWPLAVTAYNCGEGAMQKALTGTSTTTLADLALTCRQAPTPNGLKRESLDFLPQLVAAANFFTARQSGTTPSQISGPQAARTHSPSTSGRMPNDNGTQHPITPPSALLQAAGEPVRTMKRLP